MLAESGVKSGAIDFKRDVQPYLDITIADHPKTLQMVHSYQKTPTMDELMSLLYETDFGVCYLATQTLLAELPNEAPEALLATYQAEANNDYGAHYHVIKVLGWLKYAPAYELIVKEGLFNLEPQFQKSRAAAAIALGEIGDVRAISELKKVLETRTWDLKYAALMALEKLGDRSGHEIAARDADWVVAARSVG
jgi:bilin biosynthesis protein